MLLRFIQIKCVLLQFDKLWWGCGNRRTSVTIWNRKRMQNQCQRHHYSGNFPDGSGNPAGLDGVGRQRRAEPPKAGESTCTKGGGRLKGAACNHPFSNCFDVTTHFSRLLSAKTPNSPHNHFIQKDFMGSHKHNLHYVFSAKQVTIWYMSMNDQKQSLVSVHSIWLSVFTE